MGIHLGSADLAALLTTLKDGHGVVERLDNNLLRLDEDAAGLVLADIEIGAVRFLQVVDLVVVIST